MNLLKWLQKQIKNIKYQLTTYLAKYFPRFIGYISGAETLPPPLTLEEEKELLDRLEQGDKSVKRTLIERNLRLVVYIARKFDNTGIPIDDLVSIGSIGLIKAVNTFDVKKRIKLATYASRCIENEILMLLRRNNKRRFEISLDEPLNVDWDGNELLLSDVLVGTEGDLVYKNLENEVDLRLLEQALTSLKQRERVIIELRYGINRINCATQKEVADQLGISQSYVSRLEKRIIKRLKQEMEKIS
ncbi:RNA polymerase sporulation sigma factor SigE [Clostridium sp. 'deep sea']|uniref:RNA polymerase sporulation sigma factor SigE n=1 Tax=Clostridium sp. 'deep sea' TaxID=2779445 RepID=UPI0018966484|nr:RNA polymerase sporulation sigma factor SigE [Clostridium sp. 'deep sea']QOR36212.1 RNA polymerase sporulation sigma factor SigE [Clostridium sp. 'deep sea']